MSKLTVQTANIQKLLNAPRLTAEQRDSMIPKQGSVIYNEDDQVLEVYSGERWLLLFGTRTGGGGGSANTGLYAFTDATFTTGGQTGSSGPSLQQAVSGLTGSGVDAWKNNTQYFNVSNGIQQWTVPKTGTYSIEAFGARGGDTSGRWGNGARMKGDFQLTQGEIINIIVGQRGGDSGASGGGGGSFVYKNATDSLPLIVAGGGGGWGGSGGVAFSATTSTNGTAGSGAGYAGGTNGNGGSTATNSGWGGAGAGWLTNGQDGGIYGGIAFAPRNGGRGSSGPFNCSGVFGGFGGGGGGGCNGAGGGGGYSGGGTSGGGGGSYNGGTNQSNTAGANNDAGRVVITLLS